MPVSPFLTALLFSTLYGLTIFAVGFPTSAVSVGLTVGLAVPLIWLSVTDLRTHIIPDSATASVAAVGVLHHYFVGSDDLMPDILTAAAVLIILWLASEIYWRKYTREALGLGDVKLISASVLCVGAPQIWQVILIASVGGIVASLPDRLNSNHPKSAVPFGPFLAYGTFIVFAVSGAST